MISSYSRCTTRKGEIYNAFLQLLEDKLCVTPKYLSVVTSEIAGKNALLSSTEMTILQISDELNFPSQAPFGTYFKKSVGLSPVAYRKGVLK